MHIFVRASLFLLLAFRLGPASAQAEDLPEDRAGKPSVTIYRDDWGVPHIYAAREEEGFYGLGYA
jgi:acyl-homoserine lactone acylase PvdQ